MTADPKPPTEPTEPVVVPLDDPTVPASLVPIPSTPRVYMPRTSCRVCGGALFSILNLGTPVLNDFLHPDDPDPPSAPLDLMQCGSCELVQLGHTVDPNRLYRDHYWYRSGINETMVNELADVIQTAERLVPITNRTVVLDVGCNDGTLLSHVTPKAMRIGVEPCEAVGRLAGASANMIVHDFFPQATAGMPARSVDVLTSIAMFYDLDNPIAFVLEVDRLLAPDGVWIVQLQDLAQMIARTAFDNICHEHVCYYTPESFARLLEGTDLFLRFVYPRAINGGSLRFVITRRAAMEAAGIVDWQRDTYRVGLAQLEHFAWRAHTVASQIRGAVEAVYAHGRPLDLYAASTKSSTLLQWAALSRHQIRQAVERTPEKVGLVTSGTRIPIVSEEDWRRDPAPVTLIGAWQFRDAFLQREAAYLDQGGHFLVPLPEVELVGRPWVRR